jgi:precorrin-4 methylase
MRHGLAGTTPAAIVENGTTDRQRVLHSTLAEVAADAAAAEVTAPAILFVGESVASGSELAWFGEGHVTMAKRLPAAMEQSAVGARSAGDHSL